MPGSELATMEPGELADRLVEARKELFNLRFQLATGQLDNSARIRHVRREVARILTYLRQHELAEEEGEGAALGGTALGGTAHGGTPGRAGARRAGATASTAAHEDEEEDA